MLADLTALHESFLEGIKKEYSGTVPISVFAKIWNEWAQPEWVMDNVSMLEGVELTQKQIDDLEPLRRFVQINGTSPFDLTTLTDKYYRLLSVMFKLTYGATQECGLTGTSDWLGARILRSDMRSHIMKSPYRKPKDSRLYYYIQESKIFMVTDATIGSPMASIQLEYLTYPDELDGTGNITTPGNLHDYQRKEIVDRCVERYLERVRDPRWQTYLQSMNMKTANKI